MRGKDRPAIHQAFYTYNQIEINHKSYARVWKKSEGKIFPGRRFKFHSWEHWCDQSQGIENIIRREAGAVSLYSSNLLSCQLSHVNAREFPSAPFSMRDQFSFTAGSDTSGSVIISHKNTGDDGTAIFLYRCYGHPEGFDSGSRQRWPCGLSAVGVKATSYPWLTWRTPTETTASSEKQLCGYA